MDQPQKTYTVAFKPDYILPNYDGQGYGRFTLDEEFSKKLPMRLLTTRDDLARYALLLTIHDNYLMGRIAPSHFGELYRMMMREKNPLIMSTAVDHMHKIAFDMTLNQRKTLELCMLDLLGENRSKECSQYIIRKLANNAVSPEVLDKIYTLWKLHNDPAFNEHDYMDMAYRLAMTRPDQRQDIFATQRGRLTNNELREEFDFISRACDPSAEARTKLFNELEAVGLIEKTRQGQGKPDLVYVKDFATPVDSVDNSFQTHEESQVKTHENHESGVMKSRIQDSWNSGASNRNNSLIRYSERDPILSGSDGMDQHRLYEDYFRDALEMDILYLDYPHDRETLDGILDLLVETCCLKRKEVRVAGDDKPVEVVKSRLMKLNSMHIQYVMSCLKENVSDVHNIKQYLLAALYNAPVTIDPYFTAKVNHDMYGT